MEAGVPPGQADLETIARHLMAAKMYSLAACVMLFYDMALTFGQEVNQIWKKKFSFVALLWYLNRYVPPLGYIVIIISFHAEWSVETCDRYILFPEAFKLVVSSVIGIIFILRLYAIYNRSKVVLVSMSLLLVAMLTLKTWAFLDGTRFLLPKPLVGCILVGKKPSRFVFTWIAELAFDTVTFALTLWRAIKASEWKRDGTVSLLRVIFRDGVMYFGIIFGANVINVIFFLHAVSSLKAINATFSTLITSLLVSRLILNLRGAAADITEDEDWRSFGESLFHGSVYFQEPQLFTSPRFPQRSIFIHTSTLKSMD